MDGHVCHAARRDCYVHGCRDGDHGTGGVGWVDGVFAGLEGEPKATVWVGCDARDDPLIGGIGDGEVRCDWPVGAWRVSPSRRGSRRRPL